MKSIFNWTVGSFFRTIGRIVAYLIIGAIIALILMYKPKAATLTSYDTYTKIMNQESGCGTANTYSYTQYANNNPANDLWDSGTFNTQYSGKAAMLYFNFQYNLTANKYYDVDINFNTSDLSSSLTTSNVWVDSGTSCQDLSGDRVSLIGFTLSNSGTNYSNKATIRIMANTATTYWAIQLYKGVGQYVTGVNNWRINSITINEVDPSNTNIVIDNATNNTQNIINNNNDNTQQIIDNQNSNTQDTIASQNVCRVLDYGTNIGYLGSDGSFTSQSSSNNRTTDFIAVNSQSTLTLYRQSTANLRLCFYDISKSYISCVMNNSYSENGNIPIPSNARFLRFTANINLGPKYQLCSNGNQALNDSLNNLTDTLTDTDTQSDSNDVGNFLNNINLGSHNTIASIITLPINMLSSLLDDSSNADICATYKGKNICLPSGQLIWGRNHPLINTFKLFFQLVVGGYLSYKCLSSIARVIEHAVQPDKSVAEVMKL